MPEVKPPPSGAMAEMPRYRCHKIVHALKIKSVEQYSLDGRHVTFADEKFKLAFVSEVLFARFEPKAGDYYVVYADGYKAFSPAAAFEEGYTLIDDGFKSYRRSQIAELRPYIVGEPVDGISISAPDRADGSPKLGDMIARNPKNHADQWLVARQYFGDNFEPIG